MLIPKEPMPLADCEVFVLQSIFKSNSNSITSLAIQKMAQMAFAQVIFARQSDGARMTSGEGDIPAAFIFNM